MTVPLTKTVAYHWHLRTMMNEHSMQSTTDLVPLLAERGVVMTSTQVYRIVTGQPERLNMQWLAALCDIFSCTPNDLIEPHVVATSRRGRKTGTAGTVGVKTQEPSGRNRPTRAVIKPAQD
jgi:DNA-binding Xre family transcriptional regulator